MSSGHSTEYSHAVIGGGAYGCYLALRLAEMVPGARVLLVERERDLLRRASYNNQARIHNGYHYPRSLLTGLRSRINFPRFVREFSGCVVSDFQKLYAVGTHRSQVTADQFFQFCRRIGAAIQPAPPRFKAWFNRELIEEVFLVTEYAFDARKLRELLRERLAATSVRILTNTEATRVVRSGESRPGSGLRVLVNDRHSGESWAFGSQYVYNCTYANLNALPARSGLERIHLRHEATEIALVRAPECLRDVGVTVMCGPFFSVMPFPARGLFSLSHVNYTPHYEWVENPAGREFGPHRPKFPLRSNVDRMVRDAMRYVPVLSGCFYVESLWEVKTVLPQSDANDSRPILFKRDPSVPGFISVLGGKIDNIFDLDYALRAAGGV